MSSTVSIPPPVRVSRVDFPTWLPPMLVKELRQGLRTRGFVGALVIYQVVMALLMLGTLLGTSTGTLRGVARSAAFNTVDTFFWVLLTVQLLLGTPLRALAGLRTELDTRSLDLLMLTRLSAWRIVLGKWGSLLAQAVLLAVGMLPYAVVRYFGGSVDLVDDAVRCIGLLGGSAVITAVALWASGLPRGMQVAVPVAIAVVVQVGFSMARGGMGPFPLFRGMEPGFLWFNGVVLLVFFLTAAVRRIAPAAENQAPWTRLCGWLPMLMVPFFTEFGAGKMGKPQFGFAAVFLGVVCAIELATVNRPMVVHLEPWRKQPIPVRWLSRFVIPGWPSALLYTLASGALIALMVWWPALASGHDYVQVTWLVVLGIAAVVTPVVIMDLLPKVTARLQGGFYFILFASLSVFAAIATNAADGTWLETMAQVLPVSSFWTAVPERTARGEIAVARTAFALVVLGIAFAQAWGHWRALAAETRRRRLGLI